MSRQRDALAQRKINPMWSFPPPVVRKVRPIAGTPTVCARCGQVRPGTLIKVAKRVYIHQVHVRRVRKEGQA